jgi:hypothetical protein
MHGNRFDCGTLEWLRTVMLTQSQQQHVDVERLRIHLTYSECMDGMCSVEVVWAMTKTIMGWPFRRLLHWGDASGSVPERLSGLDALTGL